MNADYLVVSLRKHEGEVLHVYQDSLGVWTLGIGRNVDGGHGGGITAEESKYLLMNDIQRKTLDAMALPYYSQMNDVRQNVIIEMCFQLGKEGVAQFHGMFNCIRDSDYAGAATHMLDSLWARQTPARAAELAALMQRGTW